ncbi:peptidylprolyl isomerase [Amaricoccus sp.]|uniref:peptidylprolyl isomerase n=1 Tax=Amaricoccus sp. TaxID=1872485 RepID=UPI002615E9FF|nr:peptidylprolyl isomerase [uncultured Amaricoccus sp.]
MRRLLIAGLLAGTALVPPMSAFAADPAVYDASTVVATVNGTPITLGNVIAMRDQLPEQYQNLPDETLMTGIVQQLVDQALLAETVSASPDSDPLAVKLMLENERRGALAGRVAEATMAEPVDAAAVQAAYDKQVADFQPKPEYDASHILVATEDAAKKLFDEIKGGADFAELAKANSTDGSAQSGGELGWFSAGQMVPEFETAVVALEPGAVAGPIQTQFGWHIVKLNAKRESAPPPLDQVKPQIEAQLHQEALQAKLETLRGGAKIEMSAEAVPATAIRESDLVNKE